MAVGAAIVKTANEISKIATTQSPQKEKNASDTNNNAPANKIEKTAKEEVKRVEKKEENKKD